MYIITGICTQFFRIIIVQGSESKQISSCQIESDTLNAQLGQKLSLPETKREARNFVRIITSRASECEFDKLGRINIPSVLRVEGKLEKECIIVGVGDHVEIWNESLWQDYYDMNKDNFDEISESLDGFDL